MCPHKSNSRSRRGGQYLCTANQEWRIDIICGCYCLAWGVGIRLCVWWWRVITRHCGSTSIAHRSLSRGHRWRPFHLCAALAVCKLMDIGFKISQRHQCVHWPTYLARLSERKAPDATISPMGTTMPWGTTLPMVSSVGEVCQDHLPSNRYQECHFTQKQEDVRKDVETTFGVLQVRFAIVRDMLNNGILRDIMRWHIMWSYTTWLWKMKVMMFVLLI